MQAMFKACEVCGVEFEKPASCSVKDWQTRKFCSAKCYGQSKVGKPSPGKPFAKGHAAWNRGMVGYKAGEANHQWAGDKAGYMAVHAWVRKHFPKTGCQHCGATDRKTQWANISGEYRRDRDDWIELCVPCHKKYDLARVRAETKCGDCGSHNIIFPEPRRR